MCLAALFLTRCSLVIRVTPAKLLMMMSAKSGWLPVSPAIVVFRYDSWPATVMKAQGAAESEKGQRCL